MQRTPCIDVYILLEHFDEATITFFRQHYLEGLSDTQDKYWWPTDAEEHEIELETTDIWEMMRFLLAHPSRYIFYFSTAEPGATSTGMVFFNSDKRLILGVEVPTAQEQYYRQRLSADFHSNLLLSLGDEIHRPDSKEEFIRWMSACNG
ncbi:hypothetical protein [Hymenobacter sp. CRA2]|uniref:hypothetical protein n=1 Tax=Hymenobacter sp. CRA2 TaxID=1955620 RepID=UPI0009900D20|nr:hypothetical protein [Hymenobacter sp. CRA2]OON66218.1 hypothetical protein B0919_22275 [Hymenobacter sp. CRA2]